MIQRSTTTQAPRKKHSMEFSKGALICAKAWGSLILSSGRQSASTGTSILCYPLERVRTRLKPRQTILLIHSSYQRPPNLSITHFHPLRNLPARSSQRQFTPSCRLLHEVSLKSLRRLLLCRLCSHATRASLLFMTSKPCCM